MDIIGYLGERSNQLYVRNVRVFIGIKEKFYDKGRKKRISQKISARTQRTNKTE